MAIAQASGASIEYKPSNSYEGIDNVINLADDQKLKLQLEIEEIKKNL